MKSYAYKKIDAFTSGCSLGNPAACLFIDEGQMLSDLEMQAVAEQHKGFVSEVVFCYESHGEFTLFYYSSECEVTFCGHGTMACMHSFIKQTPHLLCQSTFTIQTHKKGALTVFNRIAEEDAVYIGAPDPVFIGTTLTLKETAKALGLAENDLSDQYPLDVIDAGLKTLIVPIRTLASEISIYPDESSLKAFCEDCNIDIILIFSMQTQSDGYHAHTRVFAPRYGYLEDPATGSGNSAFAHYMIKYGLWDGSAAAIEQGGNNRTFNTIKLQMNDGKLLFGGAATVRIDGHYYI
jgi:PhzF family phenazine biosynthesis protein